MKKSWLILAAAVLAAVCALALQAGSPACNPATGDRTPLGLFVLLMVLVAAAIVVLILLLRGGVGRKKKKKK